MKANKRDRIVKVRLTNLEYEELTKASKSSKCMSDYFRQRVFRKGVGLIDPKEFIRSMGCNPGKWKKHTSGRPEH